MKQDKMHIVNKLFNNETIRTVWDSEKEKYHISVVDIVGVLTDSTNPRHYWNVLKGRLKNEGNETVTNCDQLIVKILSTMGCIKKTIKNERKWTGDKLSPIEIESFWC